MFDESEKDAVSATELIKSTLTTTVSAPVIDSDMATSDDTPGIVEKGCSEYGSNPNI
jgi:hypothetical protein